LASDIAKAKLAKMETRSVRNRRSSFGGGQQHGPAMNSSLGASGSTDTRSDLASTQPTRDDWSLNETGVHSPTCLKEAELRDYAAAEADFGEVSTHTRAQDACSLAGHAPVIHLDSLAAARSEPTFRQSTRLLSAVLAFLRSQIALSCSDFAALHFTPFA